MKLPALTPFLTKTDFVLNYVPERLKFKKGRNILYLHYWTLLSTIPKRACHCLVLRSALVMKYDHEGPVTAPLDTGVGGSGGSLELQVSASITAVQSAVTSREGLRHSD